MLALVASRAKRKNEGKPREPEPDEGIELSKRQECWLEMFFGAIVFFGAVGWFTLEIFESWKVSLGCGIAAAILAVVLVRRGDTLF